MFVDPSASKASLLFLLSDSVANASHVPRFPAFITDTDPANVKQCVGQEDPTCSDSIPSTGINPAHLTYFGQRMFDC